MSRAVKNWSISRKRLKRKAIVAFAPIRRSRDVVPERHQLSLGLDWKRCGRMFAPCRRRDARFRAAPRLEETMLRLVLMLATLAVAFTAQAQPATPDSENGRFTFNQVADGLLRLDTRTGQVSLCSKGAVGWACQLVPDERAALESELARLQNENGALKKEMIARAVPLPGVSKPEPKPQLELKLPSDADVDRLMTFIERIWRRLLDMVQNVQKEIDKKG
jgi:hypothetical protein